MKISTLSKQAIRTIQFSLSALICSMIINFATVAPSFAAQFQVAPTPALAIFGWGDKAQSKTGNQLEANAKKIEKRAKHDRDRIEDAARSNANKAGKIAKEIKKDTDKNISKAGESIQANTDKLVDGAKKIINN